MIRLGAGLAQIAPAARGAQGRYQGPMKRDYYLYTPARVDPKKTYGLVVWVHGYKGNGREAAAIGNWTRSGDRIVVGPPRREPTAPRYSVVVVGNARIGYASGVLTGW